MTKADYCVWYGTALRIICDSSGCRTRPTLTAVFVKVFQPKMPVEDFIFQETEDGTYVRKLFGMEIMMAHMTCVLHPYDCTLYTNLVPVSPSKAAPISRSALPSRCLLVFRKTTWRGKLGKPGSLSDIRFRRSLAGLSEPQTRSSNSLCVIWFLGRKMMWTRGPQRRPSTKMSRSHSLNGINT